MWSVKLRFAGLVLVLLQSGLTPLTQVRMRLPQLLCMTSMSCLASFAVTPSNMMLRKDDSFALVKDQADGRNDVLAIQAAIA